MSPLLETRHVSKAYGAFRALDDVSIAVSAGELVALVGPNGAGKTTLVNLLTGLMAPTSGDVLFMGKSIAGVGPLALADHGLARAFQLMQIFSPLTVAESIVDALWSRQQNRRRLFSRLSADSDRARARVADIFRPRPPARHRGRDPLARREELLDGHVAWTPVILLDEPTSGSPRPTSTASSHADRGGERTGVQAILLVGTAWTW